MDGGHSSNSSATAAELCMGAKQGRGGCLHAVPCSAPCRRSVTCRPSLASPPHRASAALPSLPELASLLRPPLAQTYPFTPTLPPALPRSPQAVNDWVSEATRGKITDVVNDDLVRQASLLQLAASSRSAHVQRPCPPASSARPQPIPRELRPPAQRSAARHSAQRRLPAGLPLPPVLAWGD